MPGVTATHTEKHFNYLDSARGIAALMVFEGHFADRNFHDRIFNNWSCLIFNAGDPVSFFFVLSGFVLSYKYIVLNKSLDVKQFYVSRVFRLFPAYFLIVLWSALFTIRDRLNIHALTDMLVYNKSGFWEEALLLRFHNNFYFPGWTLTIETLCSFLMPFYIALAIQNKKLIPYLIIICLVIGNKIAGSYPFLFGVLVSCNYSNITDASFRQTKWFKYRYPILIAGIILFSTWQLNRLFPLGSTYNYVTDYLGIDYGTVTALSSFIFLVAILCSKKLQKILEHRVLVFFGKISYGVYLVHPAVMNALYAYIEHPLSGPHHRVVFILFTLAYIVGVIVFASLLHYCIELPFIRIGKHVAKTIKPSLVIKRPAAF